jgi:bis(5'-nucleosyl)-tetraphosphatase (symmetrical)
MATYAIGDIQGCYASLQQLLHKIEFDPSHDRIWLVGDLVNRGSGSLAVLRWAKTHEKSVITVLGNHDLHALVVYEGFVSTHRLDTLDELLTAPDAPTLFDWLRQQRLAYAQDEFLLVHAGVLPQWNTAQVALLAGEVEAALRDADYREFLRQMYGDQPTCWRNDLSGMDRLRVITNALTRLRICTQHGEMEFKFKGTLADVPAGYQPWFDLPARASRDSTIIFGHWSALGLMLRDDVIALDTGCLWGGSLTALRLQDRQLFQVPRAAEDAVAA